MFTMRNIALKLFRAAWANVLTSISVITISICLVMTMTVYIWNANSQMKADIQALYGEMDLMVGYNPDQQKLLTTHQIEELSTLAGVTQVSRLSLAHTFVEHEKYTTFYTVGVENDDLVKSRYHFEVNLGLNDAILSENVARLFNKRVGDSIHIQSKDFIVQEILPTIKGTDSPNIILLANDVVKAWMNNSQPQTAGIFALIKTDEGRAKAVGAEIKQQDPTLRVDVMSEYDAIKRNLQSLMVFMIVLSVFILLISSVLLLSTFQLLFYKIKEQLMILRALGASVKQVGRIVKLQLSLIISFGVMLGTTLSLVVIKSWLPQLISLLHLPEAKTELPIVFILLIALSSFIILQVMTKWQVAKSSRLLPLQIASENENLQLRWTKWKTIIVSIVGVSAVFFFLQAYLAGTGSDQGALFILLGTLLVCGILLLLIPYLFTAILHLALKPIRRVLGKEAYLACQQLMPQVRKNMPVVLSMIGLMVILTFGSSLMKTLQHNDLAYTESQYETAIKIDNELNDPTITPAIIDEIEALPSVQYAYAQSNNAYIALQLGDEWLAENYTTIDIEKFMQLKKLPQIEGGNLQDGLVVTKGFAERYHLAVGDRVTMGTYDFTAQQDRPSGELQIIGITDSPIHRADIIVDWSSFLTAQDHPFIEDIMVETSHPEQALTELSFLEERWPALKLTNKATILAQSNEMFFQRWSLFVGVFVILIAATGLGVLQTLLHTIYTKRSDYAIQRLIGLSPNGLMKLILTQVLSFVLYGLIVGTFLGFVLTRMLGFIDDGSPMSYDFLTLGLTSIAFLGSTLIVFTLQGYWMSRQKLANEIVEI
ncbi:ABC transporter permease [Lysinibacillus boronitolerans]|uniref:ABC transporter permease n=1 Tax=Lysinibacillus boronitolerans TaxID=309788 RepID=UPI002162872A|nr:ABC transporter permease [Lysinibacillus boronitolerans]MCS1390089.1 ABC transporter permease [Lysinibacillus boronitolerans]